MKSQESVLLHVVRGILKDVQAAYPAMRGLDLDFERLTLQCQTRGQALFMLDLPHLDSLLLEGLECGRLTSKGPLSSTVSKEVRVPRLFSGLWLRVFDKHACLRLDADPTSIFLLRQLCCLGKKLEVECSSDRIQAVLENYHVVERVIREPTLGWHSDNLDPDDRLGSLHFVQALDGPAYDPRQYQLFSDGEHSTANSSKASDRDLLMRLQQVADVVCDTFDFFDPHQRAVDLDSEGKGIGFKHGPGAVSEQMKNWEKSQFRFWPDKLEALFPFELCGKTIGSDRDRPSRHEKASRLICVPKTYKGPRLIAAEPASHQWCQQSILSFMNDQFRTHFHGFFIDLRDQRKSNDLVLKASRDRSLATVDLSDASDRLSCWTVERALRKHCSLLHHLHAARTRLLRDDISKNPSFLRLKKFASQGTATTFPVQSLVFLIIALTASVEGDISWQKIWKLRNWVRVFGDDIILPTHGYERLIRIMDILGLKVNMAKSYVNGHFRESCGVDGYRGYDVTPVKPKTLIADSPASCQAVVDTSNNLFNKGLWYASDSLTNTLPPRIRRGLRVVARHETGFSGLTSCSGSDESHLRKRWNPRLHRHEVRVWVLRGPTRQETTGGFHSLLDFFASKHNYEHARIVSEHCGIRKTRDGFLWEPLNSGARVTTILP